MYTYMGRNLYLWMYDGGLCGLNRSQYTASIHVTGPHGINQDTASPHRVPSYSIWSGCVGYYQSALQLGMSLVSGSASFTKSRKDCRTTWSFRTLGLLGHSSDFWFKFLVCYAATQLALQLQQERIQVVRNNKEVRRIPTESNSTPAIFTWNQSCS